MSVVGQSPKKENSAIDAAPKECDETFPGHRSDATCKHLQSVGPQVKRMADAIFYKNEFEDSVDLIPVSYFHTEQHKRSMKNFRRNKIVLKSLPEEATQEDDSSPSLVEMEVQAHEWGSGWNNYGYFADYVNSRIDVPAGMRTFAKQYFTNHMTERGKSLAGKYFNMSADVDYIVDIIEYTAIWWFQHYRARNTADRLVALAGLYKMAQQRCPEWYLTFVMFREAYYYFTPSEAEMEVQSDTLPIFDSMRSFLDRYDQIKTSPIFTKLYKFSMYCLANSLFAKIGLTMDLMKFDKVAQEALKREYHLGPDFVYTMLDTSLFLCERGYQCFKAGDIMPMFHTAEKYQQWFDKSDELIRQSNFLSNPEVHGIDRFKYLADLKEIIEQGHSMKKCALRREEKMLVTRKLSVLELTHDMEVTKRAAQKDRKTPLCVLLYGGSSIGKSTMENIMFQHYGKLRNLQTTSEYRYVRLATEAFWSGMNSTQWCVVLDDIGFMSPRLGVMDPSLAEMLCIANNVPFVPAQAELADKGRTPVRAELVIGSTNTENLNVHAYFSCPLAVQRRFPWIVDMRVRKEFEDPDKPGMLDSRRVPPSKVGEYPDFWEFKIKKVVPVGIERTNQRGRTEEHLTCANMKEFLKWYTEVIKIHNSIQDSILEGNKDMEDTKLCDLCNMPTNWCEGHTQSSTALVQYVAPTYITDMVAPVEAAPVSEFFRFLQRYDWVTVCVVNFYGFLYKYVYGSYFLNAIMIFFFGHSWFYRWLLTSQYRVHLGRVAFGFIGEKVNQRFGKSAFLVKCAAGLVVLMSSYKTISFFKDWFAPKYEVKIDNSYTEGPNKVVNNYMAPEPAELQADLHKIGSTPAPDAEYIERPCYHDKYPYSSVDLSQHTLCSKNQDIDLVKKHVESATFYITSYGSTTRNTTAVNIRGCVYMMNNHGLPEDDSFYIDVIGEARGTMTTTMKRILITPSMMRRYPEKDLAFIHLRCRPPATDLTPYFPNDSFTGRFDGEYVGRYISGEKWSKQVYALQKIPGLWKSHGRTISQPVWKGKVSEATGKGDCGSLLISKTPVGIVLLGTHVMGLNSDVAAMAISRQFVTDACNILEPDYMSRGRVEVSMPSVQRNLSDLSVQSVVHEALPGTANVIGSFTNEFRQRQKTNVGPTLIQDAMVKRGYEPNRFPPTMTKAPWIKALNDICQPVTALNSDILLEAKNMFIRETAHVDVSNIKVYSLHVAINGAPGVQYCDALNRNTSAGAPYKRSKKHYMYYINEAISTDMDVIDEIKVGISDLIDTYKRGERGHSVFCGHLKDEPIPLAKFLINDVRNFTASNIILTLTTRMYLLPVIVTMQKNRFAFEAGPGTVVQSLEWEQIKHYLCQFGEDTMIAGDYKKFDKRMPANVILTAFDIIIDMCQRAGYDKEDINVIRGIAYDTAFPTVDFNGDLIEFYGSNPSGHALTVTINGIVNPIYMRYTYIILRPVDEKRDFKQLVALMTYGDDNAMGVSSEAPWFNHTAIQTVLGEADIVYTMAEKGAVSRPYINLSEVSFLKRTWRFDEDIGAIVAPLDHSSIVKMLTMCVYKKNISRECHAIAVISTAIREYFWYGKETFQEKSEMFLDVIKECNLEMYVEDDTLPTWEELKRDFWERSKHVVGKTHVFK